METRRKYAPYFRTCEKINVLMRDQLIACAALLTAGAVLHGLRALILASCGILGAVLAEGAWCMAAKREQTVSDLSAVLTGALCALLLPPSVPLWAPLIASAFATAAVKLVFGGLGASPFNCAAVGCCFAVLTCGTVSTQYNSALLSASEQTVFRRLPHYWFAYIKGNLPVFSEVSLPERSVRDILSPQLLLRANTDPKLNAVNLLLVNGASVLGAAIPLLVIACGVWLYFRGAIAWQASLAYCASVAVCAYFARWQCISRPMSLTYDLMTGSTLLCAVFLIGDLLTAPHFRSSRILYGAAAGALTVLLRRIGSVEGGEVFAVVLMNSCCSQIDRGVWVMRQRGISFSAAKNRLLGSLRRRLRSDSDPFADIDIDQAMAEASAQKPDYPDRLGSYNADTLYHPRKDLDAPQDDHRNE